MFGSLAVPVHAARLATPPELTDIAREMGAEEGCVLAQVTTATGAENLYARVVFNPLPGCPDNAVGAQFAMSTMPGWVILPVTEGTGIRHCDADRIPPAVGRDIGICHPKPSPTYFPEIRNGTITVRPRRISAGAVAAYRTIRWRTWDRAAATGRATYLSRPFADPERFTVDLRLYRPTTCPNGERVFTRLKATPVRAAVRRRYKPVTVRSSECRWRNHEEDAYQGTP